MKVAHLSDSRMQTASTYSFRIQERGAEGVCAQRALLLDLGLSGAKTLKDPSEEGSPLLPSAPGHPGQTHLRAKRHGAVCSSVPGDRRTRMSPRWTLAALLLLRVRARALPQSAPQKVSKFHIHSRLYCLAAEDMVVSFRSKKSPSENSVSSGLLSLLLLSPLRWILRGYTGATLHTVLARTSAG